MRKIYLVLLLCIASPAFSQVVLNEICPANADINYDPDFYNFSGWIELYNSGTSAVSLAGYYLSDKTTEPLKWRIPSGVTILPNSFLLIWCDNMNAGRHTNFELDSEGEDVVFSNAAGTLLDRIKFPKQYTNISYGRAVNGSGSWAFLSVPTPGLGNNATSATARLDKPGFSVQGGRYASFVQLTLTHKNPTAEIRYTTDGSEPNSVSTKFTTAFTVNSTQTVKAKAFAPGQLPGETETHTYFINEHAFTLPVISISTKPAYLYDNIIGIYVEGTNGISGYCNGNAVNWNRDWDRHAVFEYYDKDGNRLFNQSVDVRIGGNCSRNQLQKSFAIKARDKYGSNIMNYKFFGKSINQFGGLMLRNSGNDFNITMFRDAFMQALPVGQMDVDYMDYQPTIVYLNGQYMGIQNLREKIDADFIESNYQVDKENLDLLETYENALEGSNTAYRDYKNTLAGMDRSTPAAYNFIDQHIDIQEYINYLVAEIYYANTDWPGNNMKFWRDASVNGKFRWILWDTDFGFGYATDPSHPTLNFVTATDGPDWPNPPWSTQHIRMVLENPLFRERFIQTMNTALNTTFHPDRVVNLINQFQTRLVNEIPYHKARWWGNINDWNYEVQRLRTFAIQRNAFMRQHMSDFFGLNGTVNISAEVKQGEGKIRMNEIVSAAVQAQPYGKDLPVKTEAVAGFGYRFKEWKITKRESGSVNMISTADTWKYFDQGSEPANWKTEAFDDTAWPSGAAQLGYGEGDEQTVVSFGPNAGNKYATTYFRKSFTVADTVGLQSLKGSILVDDGAVIYLNGVEMNRINMPGGAISYATFAMDGTIEGVYLSFAIPKGLLKVGNNVLAVEVHQNNAASSDLSFDLSLTTSRLGAPTVITSPVGTRTDIAESDIHYEAYFEPSGVSAITGIVINEINTTASDLLDNAGEAEDWIELYNAGSQAVSLEGLYITDNLNTRTRHQLLAGTGNQMVLQPGQYKILWADEDTGQGPDHLDFKLSADGEAVGLYQVDGENIRTLDEYVFDAQLFKGSFSRIPNATGPFIFTTTGTPGAFNEIITGVEQEQLNVSIYPNPVADNLYIESPAILEQIQLTDCFGRTLEVASNVYRYRFSLLNNPPGIYILRLKSGNRLKTVKIIKQ